MIGGQVVIALAYEDWARDNLVRAFAYTWAGAVLVWLILDWLGNPNRGRFRPQGPRRVRGIRRRISAWRDRRDNRDAEIRETLRATYGKSSLRLGWSTFDETSATAHDEARLTPVPQLFELGAEPPVPPPTLETAAIDIMWGNDGLEAPAETREDELIDLTAAAQVELFATAHFTTDNDHELIDLTDNDHELIDLTDNDHELIDLTTGATGVGAPSPSDTAVLVAEPAPPVTKVGWQLGDDPRSPTMGGATPTRTTVRSRAWKNQAAVGPGVGDENRRRMTKGRPPRRWNPITGRRETASIDLDDDSFEVTWSTAGIDPFARRPDRDREPIPT